MAQTPLFANSADLSALNVLTFVSSRFIVVSVRFLVAEWSKAPEFDAKTGGESPVQAPVWAVTFSP